MFLLHDHSTFKPLHRPQAQAKAGDWVFAYERNKIALTYAQQLPQLPQSFVQVGDQAFYCFGELHGRQCLLPTAWPTVGLEFIEAKLSHQFLPRAAYQAVALGNHLQHWRSAHHYCGKCASPMRDKISEQARVCAQCQHIVYPKISPCVIVLITRGKEMLLGRSPHFPPGMMSALAGFAAIGESAEQAVIREVKEEVGVHIHQLKYVCSQPWPFPDSLMLGFTAEYLKGDICIDHQEIEAAGWFNADNLPSLPTQLSIARYLIEQHLAKFN